MLKNLWYVLGHSTDVRAEPVMVTALGQKLVLFRDSAGLACVLSDVCAHRGGSLSHGRMVGGEVACPYHGWRYDGNGICTHIPAQPGQRVPARARVDAYPTVERFGWVWAFLGDLPPAQRPPLPDLSWAEDPRFRLVRGHFDWDASWDRVMENGLDFAHAPFVHGTAFGDPAHPEIDDFTVEAGEWQGEARMRMYRPRRRSWPAWLARGAADGRVPVYTTPGYHFSGPCTTLRLEPRPGWEIRIVSAHLPVDAKRTRTLWMMGRTFMKSALLDARTRRSNLRIFEQDHAVLSRVCPQHTPDDWQEEVSVRSDGLQIAFRKTLKALQSRGWEIDLARMASEFAGRKACAIPCPARRESSAWAIAGVPTRGGG